MKTQKKKSNFKERLRQETASGTTVAPNRYRIGQSNRLGHPSRNIVRPKRLMTTSSSDKEIIKRRRKKQLDSNIDIDKEINDIRSVISNNKENETANVQNSQLTTDIRSVISNNKENETANVQNSQLTTDIRSVISNNKANETANVQNSQLTTNSPSFQSVQSTEQLYMPLNAATGNFKQPENTYTDLLPPSSTQDLNLYAAGKPTVSPSISSPLASYNIGSNYTFPQSTSTVQYSSQYGQGFYGLPFSNAPIYQSAPAVRLQKQVTSTVPSLQGNTQYGHSQSYITSTPHNEPIPITICNNAELNTSGSGNAAENQNLCNSETLLSLHTKIDNVMTKENYENLNKKLDKLLRKRMYVMPQKPPSFPLASVEQVQHFDHATEEEYEVVVEYLRFLGGFTLHDAVKFCLKETLTDETVKYYSAWGERGNRPLSTTNLIKAIYDAVALNPHFRPPTRDEFYRAVAEAVRGGKQRNRNNIIRNTNAGGQRGQRNRRRHEADQFLGLNPVQQAGQDEFHENGSGSELSTLSGNRLIDE